MHICNFFEWGQMGLINEGKNETNLYVIQQQILFLLSEVIGRDKASSLHGDITDQELA